MSKIGIIGSGNVGVRLANGLSELKYDVILGSNTKKSVDGWEGEVASFIDTAKNCDKLILAVKGGVAEDVIKSIRSELKGKIVIDATNPIEGPPEDGVLRYFTDINHSLMERLSELAPSAQFAKAFNSVGNNVMFNPSYGGTKATMFICGDEPAKKFANEILEKIGWEVADLGGKKSAGAIESLCILWCSIGFNGGGWDHAFKLLKTS